MIILMLLIKRNLRLTTLHMLQNGLIFLIFVWSYTRLYTRLYHKRDEFDFPIVNCPYLNSNIPESSADAVRISQLIRYARCFVFFEIWRYSVQRIYSGFKVIEAGIFSTETSDYFSKILWSPYIPCSQIWHFCVTCVEGFVHQLWYNDLFRYFV